MELRRSFITWLLTAVVGCVGVAAAQAEPVSAADAKQIRAVVQAQLDAFAADDATRAFSYAAPAIREMFGTADRFMAMVRASYPVVYRPASVAFLVAEAVGADVVQGVQFTDGAGGVWLGIYQLQKQPDGSWRIGGCQLVASHARTT